MAETRAGEVVAALEAAIARFQGTLGPEQEVGFRLQSGPAEIFHFEGLRALDAELVEYSGRADDNRPITLIQHVGLVSIVLAAVRKRNETVERFGFIPSRDM